jgi:hypothetical protein
MKQKRAWGLTPHLRFYIKLRNNKQGHKNTLPKPTIPYITHQVT